MICEMIDLHYLHYRIMRARVLLNILIFMSDLHFVTLTHQKLSYLVKALT